MRKKTAETPVASNRATGMQAAPLMPLGIHKSWKSDAAMLLLANSVAAAPADPQSPPYQRFAAIQSFADGGNPFRDVMDATQPRRGPLYAVVADALWGNPEVIERWTTPMLQGEPMPGWLADFAHDTAYAYWRWRIKCQAHGNWMRVFLEVPASVLARCLFLGWMEEARMVAESIRGIYQQRLLANVSGPGCQPLNHLLLRIVFDYWDLPFEGWGKGHNPRLDPKLDPKDVFHPNECFGEPVLNAVFDHWRDQDLTALSDHLIWMADYTTHRLSSDMEFAWGGPIAARLPGVLLPLARLRASLGLGMPSIAHPLLTAPWAQLPEPCPRHTDPLLERVLDRLQREELPALRGGTDSAIRFIDREQFKAIRA